MINFISHRGNLDGENKKWENHPDYICEAIDKGYSWEIDVWFENWSITNNKRVEYDQYYWLTGHDVPTHKISKDFLLKFEVLGVIYAHAKTIPTMYELNKLGIHNFYHDGDRAVYTSQGKIWTNIGQDLTQKSIAVLPEKANMPYKNNELKNCYGICSDNIKLYRRLLPC